MTEDPAHRLDARLGRIRGAAPPRRHNARTIAALTTNPGCARRAVIDAAGVDKEGLARHVGLAAPFGQSRFAITRGNAFEAQVKADGCAVLLRLLGDLLGLELPAVEYTDLGSTTPAGPAVGLPAAGHGHDDQQVRHEQARARLAGAAAGRHDPAAGRDSALFDHPLLRLDVGGRQVYLEPDLVAFQHAGVFHVVEIKSFAVVDRQADGGKVAAAAIQSAVYVLALRRLLGRPDAVSHNVVLVCPKDFSNTPTAALIDVRRQLSVLEHQLARLARVDALLDDLPADLTLDLAVDAAGAPTRPVAELAAALGRLPARYAPDCLSTCELSYFCRDEARGCTVALGKSVREELGGVETVAEVIGLADGTRTAGDDLADTAARLRAAARMYADLTG